MPRIIRAIWTTEEYAIITFKSLNLTHVAASIPPPTSEMIRTLAAILRGPKNTLTRIIPYPPSFSRTPARIIEPPTGASTWALGSHWCTKNIGNFTKNAPINIIVGREFIIAGVAAHAYMYIYLVCDIITVLIITINSGKDANKV